MSDDNHGRKKGGAFRWFLKKLFSTPATYLGALAGFLVGKASLGAQVPMGGAIGSGVMIGLVVGVLSFLMIHGIKASHRKALESEAKDPDSKEPPILNSLRSSGLTNDADLLEKILSERDAIRKHGDSNQDTDAAHTLELASAIAKESCRQAEELHDLVRRVEDPLLEAPGRADEKIESIRAEFRKAYQALADARSRLRRGEQLKETDFLSGADSISSQDLSALSSRLEEETAVSRRVEDRLWPKDESGVVMDDPVESAGEDLRENE